MSVNLPGSIQSSTLLPPELCSLIELYAVDTEEALTNVAGDFSKLSPQMQAQIKENGKTLQTLNIPKVVLTKEIMHRLLKVFPKLEQLTVQQGCIKIERQPKAALDKEWPYTLDYVVEASYAYSANTSHHATEKSLLTELLAELNGEVATDHCQYELAIVLPQRTLSQLSQSQHSQSQEIAVH